MTDRVSDIELADIYVRNELTGDEEAEFEVRMLGSSQLQQHVQTALAIRESLKLEELRVESSPPRRGRDHLELGISWGHLAVAASVLLAVVSTLMFVKANIESKQLNRQIAQLIEPQTSVLTVPVNIMRSVGAVTPDVIVQKPSAGSIIQLNIELSAQAQAQTSLLFTLVNEERDSIIRWQASPSATGYSIVLIRSEQIPTGLAQLQVSDTDGNILGKHSLEFRPSLD